MLQELFPDSVPIDRTAPEGMRADFAAVPGKAAVYMLAGQDDSLVEVPLLVATVGDLRSALKRRLADAPPEGAAKTKRIAYAQVCTRVYWRRVDSAFSANYGYDRAARALFPQTAKVLLPWRDSWWIAVERDGDFPRFRKTTNLSDASLAYAGPVRDKHAAQRLIESLEDLFDLCRYHNILVQAPHGKPCAYKEMGKCPAPCDGSIPLSAYRRQMEAALAFAVNQNRREWRSTLEAQMKAAADGLLFEQAGRIKQRLTRAGLLQNEALAHLGRLEDFSFLTLQPGKGKPWTEPWLITQGCIECLPQLHIKDFPAAAEPLAAACRERLSKAPALALSSAESGQIALAAYHLFKGESDHGIWLRMKDVVAEGPAIIMQAIEQLRARKAPKPLAEQSSDIEPPVASAPAAEPAAAPAGPSA